MMTTQNSSSRHFTLHIQDTDTSRLKKKLQKVFCVIKMTGRCKKLKNNNKIVREFKGGAELGQNHYHKAVIHTVK